MRATDLLLHAGGFGVVLLDLSEAQTRVLNSIRSRTGTVFNGRYKIRPLFY